MKYAEQCREAIAPSAAAARPACHSEVYKDDAGSPTSLLYNLTLLQVHARFMKEKWGQQRCRQTSGSAEYSTLQEKPLAAHGGSVLDEVALVAVRQCMDEITGAQCDRSTLTDTTGAEYDSQLHDWQQ